MNQKMEDVFGAAQFFFLPIELHWTIFSMLFIITFLYNYYCEESSLLELPRPRLWRNSSSNNIVNMNMLVPLIFSKAASFLGIMQCESFIGNKPACWKTGIYTSPY